MSSEWFHEEKGQRRHLKKGRFATTTSILFFDPLGLTYISSASSTKLKRRLLLVNTEKKREFFSKSSSISFKTLNLRFPTVEYFSFRKMLLEKYFVVLALWVFYLTFYSSSITHLISISNFSSIGMNLVWCIRMGIFSTKEVGNPAVYKFFSTQPLGKCLKSISLFSVAESQ